MEDYPDPDEEYELMYADELDLLREQDQAADVNIRKALPAKRSLDFSSPVSKKTTGHNDIQNRRVEKEISENQISLTPLTPLPVAELTPVSNKRTAEELFGDIGDIDFNDFQLPSKKQKTEEETDLELIEKILEGRRLRQLLLEPSSRIVSDARPAYDAKENLSVNIPRWAFIPLTKADGERIYVRLESEESWESSLKTPVEPISLSSSYTSTWEEARKILEAKQQEKINSEKEPVLPEVSLEPVETKLWVDKYRPESYFDLLSEEPVNRALLHWLHLWDKVVFKKEVKTKEPQQRNSFNKRSGQFQLSNKWRGKAEAEPELEEDGRPRHKVALLCGPPGAGKTTLAHLLARLAGYRPVELNASDERSTDAFRTALQSATLMRPLVDADRRPNCLVLDEIDGAPLPTVELLVKWCTASTTDKKKGKGHAHPLRRPVIAICNDLYAPALRTLRPISLIIQVGSVSTARLSARLSLVSSREGIPAPPRVLSALAARAKGDVRAAITYLALYRYNNRQITMEDVERACIGSKDCGRTALDALRAVFTADGAAPGHVLDIVRAAGEYDRIIDGIFEQYLSMRVDAGLLVPCSALSWLALYDVLVTWTGRTQNYALYGVLPYTVLQCHRLLATRAPPRVKFPQQAREMAQKKAELDSIVYSVWRGCSPSVVGTRRSLRLDTLPLLPWLLAPALRSANVQLCTESERGVLRTVAGAMCEYGLQYAQRRTPDGLYAFQLEPDVHKLAFIENCDRARPPPAVRAAIAREQQLEMIRRTEQMAAKVAQRPGGTRRVEKPVEGKSDVTRIPNHLQRLEPKQVKPKAPQVHKDFFGRIVPLSQVQRSDAVPDVISSSSIFYQYREGFNNAVRRNVRTKDLL